MVASLFKSRARLEAENAALLQQLVVLRRKLPGRAGLTNGDRLFFGWLYRLLPSVAGVMLLAQPETLVRWHRAGFRRYWRWKSRRRLGRPPVDGELRELIRRMSRKNLLWGAPRIHGELLKLGFQVAQSTVAKYMVKRRGPPSQGWKTFLRNHYNQARTHRSLNKDCPIHRPVLALGTTFSQPVLGGLHHYCAQA